MGCGSKRAMPQKKKSQRQVSKANRASPPKRTESSSRQEAEESDRADDEREGAVPNVPTPRRESADEETRDVGRLRQRSRPVGRGTLMRNRPAAVGARRISVTARGTSRNRARLAKGERRPEGASLRYAAASRSPEATDLAVDV